MENTYWNGNGKFQKEYEVLKEQFISDSTPSSSYLEEAVKAMDIIYTDGYNGFPNNTSGALYFLHYAIDDAVDSSKFSKALDYLEDKVNHFEKQELNDRTKEALEDMVDGIIEYSRYAGYSGWFPLLHRMADYQQKDWTEEDEYLDKLAKVC